MGNWADAQEPLAASGLVEEVLFGAVPTFLMGGDPATSNCTAGFFPIWVTGCSEIKMGQATWALFRSPVFGAGFRWSLQVLVAATLMIKTVINSANIF